MLNKKLFLFCLTLIVLIILINLSSSISKFGSANVLNITIASSDVTKTTFVLQKYTYCYSSVCDDPTYKVITPNPLPNLSSSLAIYSPFGLQVCVASSKVPPLLAQSSFSFAFFRTYGF